MSAFLRQRSERSDFCPFFDCCLLQMLTQKGLDWFALLRRSESAQLDEGLGAGLSDWKTPIMQMHQTIR